MRQSRKGRTKRQEREHKKQLPSKERQARVGTRGAGRPARRQKWACSYLQLEKGPLNRAWKQQSFLKVCDGEDALSPQLPQSCKEVAPKLSKGLRQNKSTCWYASEGAGNASKKRQGVRIRASPRQFENLATPEKWKHAGSAKLGQPALSALKKMCCSCTNHCGYRRNPKRERPTDSGAVNRLHFACYILGIDQKVHSSSERKYNALCVELGTAIQLPFRQSPLNWCIKKENISVLVSSRSFGQCCGDGKLAGHNRSYA